MRVFVCAPVALQVIFKQLLQVRRSSNTCHPLPFLDLSRPFLDLSLHFDFALPFPDHSLTFLDFSLPFLDRSPPFTDRSLPSQWLSTTCAPLTGEGDRVLPDRLVPHRKTKKPETPSRGHSFDNGQNESAQELQTQVLTPAAAAFPPKGEPV